MNPNIWGPQLWFSLHIITFNYPNNPTNNDKLNYKNFFNSLANVIPCTYCKHNFKIHMKKLPLINALQNKNTLIKWLFDIHNLTNKHLNKKIFSYQEFMNKYKIIFQKKIYTCNYYYIYLFIIFFIIFIILYYLYFYNNKNYSINFP